MIFLEHFGCRLIQVLTTKSETPVLLSDNIYRTHHSLSLTFAGNLGLSQPYLRRDMSTKLTPAKRPHDRSPAETNGRWKWQRSSSFSSQRLPAEVRMLCPASKIDLLIGKDSSTISQIREDSGAEVRVEDSVVGCDERVIVIVGSGKEDEVVTKQLQADVEGSETKEKDSCNDENGDKGENKVSLLAENSKTEKENESIQKALFVIFDRMVEGGVGMDGGDEEGNDSSSLIIRLLIHSSQVGCMQGKGGSVIKQMSSESGAQIRILPRDKRPSCASSSDELVQISGERDAVKKALEIIARQLLEGSSGDQDFLSADAGGPSTQSPGRPLSNRELWPPSARPYHGQGLPSSVGFRDGEVGIPGRMNPIPDALTFRLLCPDEKVGGIIGKGGSIIKALQHETGCQIKVLEGAGDAEDRVIVISGPAHPDDRVSLAQDAVLRIQSRIFRAAPENQDNVMVAKLLVFSNQIGCLLGKGGGIIAEMRKSTGAYIRIVGKDQTPKCAAENEEVVQINGDAEKVHEALLQITSRLQNHYFRDAFPSNPGFLDQVPPFPSHMGGREFSPPGMFPNIRPPFHKFDALPPHGGFHPHDDRPPFMQNFHRPGIPPHISDRMPSSAPWGPQGLGEGGGQHGFPDYAGGPRSIGGFGGGSHPAVITSTTVEVVVPRSVVPAIYGEGGGCLRQICEISDAKVTINDPKPGATETVIIISGTPEQTNAAQSLIQAFVMVETEAA
ncbi:KH domain-containing protein HEN4-like isoform X2 [Lycium barbarum]|uniref:KH domain-containing protein HEN4-like isoform X2 n=1 Tax=Lycium barbarum TaxID=112863 RepID=UPI00293E5AAA|nr:KH domain-containing protein HEN4-like isoform X2 [Lycium barbarum]